MTYIDRIVTDLRAKGETEAAYALQRYSGTILSIASAMNGRGLVALAQAARDDVESRA